MNILGVSAFSRNTSACLIRDGKILSAAQEERFSRRKYDSSFPRRAIDWNIKFNKIGLRKLDCVAFSDNSLSTRLKAIARFGLRARCVHMNLEEAYLAAAFYPSNLNDALILVNDSRLGIVLGKGSGNRINKISGKSFSSLGRIYSEITRYLGFNGYGDEFKVMGLAAYGKPVYKNIILKHRENSRTFLYQPKRVPGSDITQFHKDVAASLQEAIEEETLKITEYLSSLKISENLCICGNLGLNCLLNSRIVKQGLFKSVWVQPASDSSGTAVGAALLVWFKELNNKREVVSGQDLMNGTLLGPEYGADYIVGFLRKNRIKYREETEFDIPRICAGLISQGKVVGWFQGRVEFGARALGDRSILGDSRDLGMHKKLNLEVKRREPFRPFAPTVLLDKAGEYFELANESPYMLFTFQAKDEKREEIPAVVHVDGSSRVQTLRKEDNPLYYELLNEYYKKTGCPAIINTSFNTKGEPMVLSPEDAYRCFVSSKIDCLVMGRFLIEK